MGQGYVRNDTSNNIADGNVISAADLDGEFDAIVAAFDGTTGHTHDGTSAEGAPIEVTGPAQEYLFDGTAIYPKVDDTYDIGKVGAEFKDLYLDGVGYLDSAEVGSLTVSGTATFSGGTIADLGTVTTVDINGGTIDGVTIGGSSAGAGTFSSLVATTADINAGTIDNTVIGGVTPAAGTFTTATVATADINGGNIDGTVIGGDTPSAGTFGNLTVVGSLTANGNITLGNAAADTVTFNADVASNLVPNLDATHSLGTASFKWRQLYVSGVTEIGNLTATTADINGGTVDGVTIGGSVSAAGTFTNATVSGTLTFDGVTYTATTGSDTSLVSGTAGSNGDLAGWNTDGDLVDSGFTVIDEDDMSSNSATAVPTQQSVKAYVDSSTNSAREIFTSSGTWTKPADLPADTIIKVQVWSDGGGGDGGSTGAGGGGGAYAVALFLASDLGATETVTVGTGGGASVSGTGSSFGTHLVCSGGERGGTTFGGSGGTVTTVPSGIISAERGADGGNAGVNGKDATMAGAGGGGDGAALGGTSIGGGDGGDHTVAGSARGGGGGQGAVGGRGEVVVWIMS